MTSLRLNNQMSEYAPTSPSLPTDTVIQTKKQFSDSLTQELTDAEIQQATELLEKLKTKWRTRFISKLANDPSFTLDHALELISEMSDEVSYLLATELNVLASVDTTPILEGKPPVIEWIGAMPGHSLNKHGFDHEKKAWEAKKAKDRGEDWLGQKEETNTGKAKKRNKNG